jgi:ribosome-binding protein aMBF1 (putative translation factor)
MEHQDWTPVILNKTEDKDNNINKKKNKIKLSQKPPEEDIKMEPSTKLGQLICQARTAKSKTQKQLSANLGISNSVLSRWETNKEVPSNADIAKIEKVLGIKLPRSKKVKVDN